MFKKRITLNDFIDSTIQEILNCQPIEIKSLNLDTNEIARISNEVPIFGLVVILNYLANNVTINTSTVTVNYFLYKLDEIIDYMRRNDLINSTDIKDIKNKVFLGYSYSVLKFLQKENDKFYKDNGMVNDGFILCESYVEQFSFYKDFSDEENRIKHTEIFNAFSQVYKNITTLLKKYRIKKLNFEEEKSIINLINELNEKRELELKQKEIEKKTKHKLSKEGKKKVLQMVAKMLETEQDKSRFPGLIVEHNKDEVKDKRQLNIPKESLMGVEGKGATNKMHVSLGTEPEHSVAKQLEELFKKK